MEPIETIETVLEHLALSNLSSKFDDEQIDLDALVCFHHLAIML